MARAEREEPAEDLSGRARHPRDLLHEAAFLLLAQERRPPANERLQIGRESGELLTGRGIERAVASEGPGVELEAGRSVVLTGPYGIGRTSLVRHLAADTVRQWAFVIANFDHTPGEVWRDLFAALFPRAFKRQRGETGPAKWTRFRVLNQPAETRRRHVVVLHDVARLTAPKLDLLRRVRERYQVIAIAEDFLPEAARVAICQALWAWAPLRLTRLGPAATLTFFEQCSRSHGFLWSAGEIRGLARATHGFPLGMREAVEAEHRRRESAWGRKGARITPEPPASPPPDP